MGSKKWSRHYVAEDSRRTEPSQPRWGDVPTSAAMTSAQLEASLVGSKKEGNGHSTAAHEGEKEALFLATSSPQTMSSVGAPASRVPAVASTNLVLRTPVVAPPKGAHQIGEDASMRIPSPVNNSGAPVGAPTPINGPNAGGGIAALSSAANAGLGGPLGVGSSAVD